MPVSLVSPDKNPRAPFIMSYSLNLIALASDADILIQTAQRDKRNLQHRRETLMLRSENSAEDSAAHAAELSAATASLAAANATIASLPEGEKKEEEITKKMELELKIRKLSKSGNKLGTVATIEREYDADQLTRQIDGIDAFISAVTARKAEL